MDNELVYSPKSWHYRLIKYTWEYTDYRMPSNLCPYLRRLVLSLFCGPIFFLWRSLPYSITRHETIIQILVGYGIIVHLTMFVLTVSSGGVFNVTYVGTHTDIEFYNCAIPYDISSCKITDTIAPESNISFTNDGELLKISHEVLGMKVTTYIEWWWGWAFYFISVFAVSGAIGLIFGMFWVYDRIKDMQNRKLPKYEKHQNQTTKLLSDYIHAKHSKMCPGLRFEDKE